MAALFQVTVTAVEDRQVTTHLSSEHPDQGWVPAVENIALQLVLEAWEHAGSTGHPRADDLGRWRDAARGADVEVSKEAYEASTENKWFDAERGYFLRGRALPFLLISAANVEIVSVGATHLEASPPTVEFVFELADDSLASLFKEGVSWSSTAYNIEHDV